MKNGSQDVTINPHISYAPNSKNKAMHKAMNKDDHIPSIDASAPPAAFPYKECLDKTLDFLSTASNETLVAIAVALVAGIYMILGRVGLLLLGALGGALAQATWWEGLRNASGPAVVEARRETSLDIVKRILDSRGATEKAEGEDGVPAQGGALTARGFGSFRPETAAALEEFVDAVIRDYVKWWYGPILPNENTFPSAAREALRSFILSVSTHLSRKRPADSFLNFLTNSSSIFTVVLSELSQAFSASPNPNLPAADVVYEYLAANPDSSLANILSVKQLQKKFQSASDALLETFLERSVYDCKPARTFLKQILAGVVLESSLTTCSKPEWINGWIVYLLEAGEPELMEAIDAGMALTPADDIDGNVGNISLAKTASAPTRSKKTEQKGHKKRLSRAEEAMEEALVEAKRLDSNGPSPLHPKSVEVSSNGNGHKGDEEPVSPATTTADLHSPKSANSDGSKSSFTNFDQILAKSPLTLHNANITIYDDSAPGDKGKVRSKPTAEYLLQIEPESSQHTGWMIPRKYSDFESLHSVLIRIAKVSGVTAFTEQHGILPHWKGHTKASLRGELERYLREACWHQPLAESEGMKRFLEKDRDHFQEKESKTGFAGINWSAPQAFETMGKGMIDAIASAPKGAAEGGKAVFGGVTGVINNIGALGNRKASSSLTNMGVLTAGRASMSNLSRSDSIASAARPPRSSEDSNRVASSPITTQPPIMPPMERQASYNSITESENEGQFRLSFSQTSSISRRGSATASREPSQARSLTRVTSLSRDSSTYEDMNLPPPPNEMPDDYGNAVPATPTSTSTAPSVQSPEHKSISSAKRPSVPSAQASAPALKTRKEQKREAAPLSIQDTAVAVELIFAVVNELYTLSSAWNIRRTLLNAAKTFLLRPGNPSLSSIQTLIQDSVIASNTSDTGIAAHIRKLRENTLPTPEELKQWPTEEMSVEDKEKLRVKARKLFVENGVPAALSGVMGQGATSEAMGRVFDCLQVEEVVRGLIGGLLLQGVREIAT